jgi:hypothetical protein
MLSLHYALTKDDYINYYTYVAWDSPANKKKRFYYYTRQMVPLLIFLFAFYYTGLFDRPGKFIFIIGSVLLAITLLSFINVRSNTIRTAERVADDPNNGSIFLELNVVISETGIVVKDELKESKYRWEAILRKAESKNYYFLFHNAVQAIIIPKRVFNTADEKGRFEKLLTQYLSFEADVLAG